MPDPNVDPAPGQQSQATPEQSAASVEFNPVPPPEIRTPEAPLPEPSPQPEDPTPMLDVHAPHHAVHTWKDFLIHIVAIVIGLLIAVGLEQTVEYLHHQHQVAQLREALRKEGEINKFKAAQATTEFRRFVPVLETDLAILHYLQKHPGAPAQQWPGEFRVRTAYIYLSDSSWTTAQQNGTVSLMPSGEARRYSDIYARIAELRDLAKARMAALDEFRIFSIEDPDPSHLGATELATEIDRLDACLLAEFRVGRGLWNLNGAHPDLELSAPTLDDLNQIVKHLRTPENEKDVRVIDAILKESRTAQAAVDPIAGDEGR